MLVNREECRTHVQLRSDHDRLMATSAYLSYLTWQGVPHSIGQVPNHLSHPSGLSPSDTPESWDIGHPGWVSFCEGLLRHLGGLSVFSGGGPPYDLGTIPLVFQAEFPQTPWQRSLRLPWLPRRRSSWSIWTAWLRPPGLPGHPGGGPSGPLGSPNGGPAGPPGPPGGTHQVPLLTWDLKTHPDSLSCAFGKVVLQ